MYKTINKHSIGFIFLLLIQIFACGKIGTEVKELGPEIRTILQDNNGNHWLGSERDGLFMYDGHTLIQFTEKDGLPHPQIRAIKQDIHGKIWIVTGYGICYYDGKEIIPFKDDALTRDSLSVAKWPLSSKDIYLQAGSGFYCYDGEYWAYVKIVPPAQESIYSDLQSNMPATTLYSIERDKRNHRLYIGTQSIGMVEFTGKSIRYLATDKLSTNVVRCIFQDSKHNIWYGTNGGGLFVYDGRTTRNITKELKLNDGDTLSQLGTQPNLNRIWAIAEDDQQQIWIGSVDFGLWKYTADKITPYGAKEGLKNQSIKCIYFDTQKKLWIGTGDDTYILKGEKFEKVNFKD